MDRIPLVSIVIPTYFRESVVNAVESGRNQSYDNIEVIVVDDSGEGFARQLVDEDEIVSLHCLNANRGAMEARKIGYRRSSGEYIQFLDDDDTLKPTKIARCVEVLSAEEECPVVYTGVRFRDEDFYPDSNLRGDVLDSALRFEMFPCSTSTMSIRRDALASGNPFNPLPGGDDLQMMIELAQLGPFEFVDDILVEKGDPPRSKGGSKASVEGRITLLDRYSNLYDQAPQSVYQTAKSNAEFHNAKYHLSTKVWSATGVMSMIRHCYWNPNADVKCILKVFASLFGGPGWRLSERIYSEVAGE